MLKRIEKIKEQLLKKYEKDTIQETLKISFDEDVKRIKSKEFKYYKLFLTDSKNSVNGLTIQQNKLISKIGLQYFTTIVKDLYYGFIKTSSYNSNTKINETAILYNHSEGEFFETKNFELVNYGTYYNCIIPIKNWERRRRQKKQIKKQIAQEINSFKELNNYNLIEVGYNDKKVHL